ncbi:MAG: anhydro-N-acetylmuramic acid kinase [Nitrospiraceae bacterium]|nr:anhydro-N-acetylmuramic acid kinase [Nitrospiraceae bacterium]
MGREGRIILGLMSGTSHDGVDAAIVKIRKNGRVKLLFSASYPFPRDLGREIGAAPRATAGEICTLNFRLGHVFADAATACIETSGIRPDAIASHGQTIFHIPPAADQSADQSAGQPACRSDRKGRPGKSEISGSTLQIGEPSVIAALTGVPVVAGFRPADMAAGGQGAPLVPFADHVIFGGRAVKAVQNIGGIANVTVVTPSIDDVIAFDTGPGNCLIDIATEMFFSRPMDRGGRIAAKGKPDEALLKNLLAVSYLKKAPPKSTGRELFGEAFLARVLKGAKNKNKRSISAADVISTLTHFTALSIRDAYGRFILGRYPIEEVILTGGGAKNGFLVGLLRGLFSPLKVSLIEDYGIPGAAKEAMSFAILANETLCGRPSNVPGATGARRKAILGGIYLP